MKILFFSPFSGVLPHVRAESQLAEGLQKIGHDVVIVNCDGVYRDFCSTMSAHGLHETADASLKEEQCRLCRRVRDLNKSRFQYSTEWVDSELTSADTAHIESLVNSVSRENWIDFSNDGLPVGKIASYEFIIHYKKNSYELSDIEFSAYKIALKNTLITQYVMDRVLRRVRPDRVLIFDTGYSVNGMAKALAEQAGILVYNLFLGQNLFDRLEKVTVDKSSAIAYYSHMRSTVWQRVKGLPVPRSQIENVARHFHALFEGANILAYSAPRTDARLDVRSRFGIAPSQKIIVATMSSYDESFACTALDLIPDSANALFPTQAVWCSSLIDWMKTRPEYFLIIRVHPREFPNKREGRQSVHIEELKAVFQDLPVNVAINWPSDNLSLYNIAEEADVFLNAWSSVGVEMSLLGLPVVVYDDALIFYPSDLNFLGKTRAEYYARIEEAVAHGWDFEKMRMTFRWLATLYSLPAVDLPFRTGLWGLLQRAFGLLGRKTGRAVFMDRASWMYIDQSRFNEKALRQIEDVLLNQRSTLADVPNKRDETPVSHDEEAEFIRIEMEGLFTGRSSRIISNLRAHFRQGVAP